MIVDSLVKALQERDHLVDIVQIPLLSYWRELPEQMLALRLLDLTESAGTRVDRLITIRYPSYALQHPHKAAWFIHHHRGAYDLWGTEYQDLPNTVEGQRARALIVQADTLYLKECQRLFTNSKTVADRLKVGNNLEADGVLFPPHPHPELFRPGTFGDYFLYSARLAPIKRQELAIRAMQHVRSPFRLVLVGAPDTETYRASLANLAEQCGVAARVHFTGWVSEAEKAQLTADAYGVLYIPFDEDSYGYSTLEGFHASKPIITGRDSGGTHEVIVHGDNGLIVEPTPEALAEAMEALWANRARSVAMGEQALATLTRHRIDWDHVVDGLLG